MILSRSVKSESRTALKLKKTTSKEFTPSISKYLIERDYQGALTLIDFVKKNNGLPENEYNLEYWKACCYFRLGEYEKALQIFNNFMESEEDETLTYNAAVCNYYLGQHDEAEKLAFRLKDSSDKNKLMLHLTHDESEWAIWRSRLKETAEDQFCLASQYYIKGQYQDAIDIYKQLLVNDRSCLAANVYIALCYFKLDYYDVSQEVLTAYLTRYPDSTIAVNLKACNLFKLYNGEAAERELKSISSENNSFGQDLVRHNMVVFKNGEGALKVFPDLINKLPEARINLATYRLKNREPDLAAPLLTEDAQVSGPYLHILRGLVAAEQYYLTRDELALAHARASLEAVGTSTSDCDTVPGRQSMASALLLAKRYNDALIYLNSIRSFFVDDDVFNFNYAQTKLALGNYKEAEECFVNVKTESITTSHTYVASLCRCYIMNGKPDAAWELCLQSSGSADSAIVLQLIANDCYKMGHFLVAARAFHMLDRMERSPETWEGMRGACAGAIQEVVAGLQWRGERTSKCAGVVREVAGLMRGTSHAAAVSFLKALLQWAASASIVV